jgi:thiosulfate/3-mercaptopyruvate sulfurtransferase
MFSTLIDCATVAQHLSDPTWIIVDCRFDLTDPGRGERMYLESHIPGAGYAHLDRDLSGAKSGTNGRHPLPTRAQMTERFGAMGIGPGVQVVAYDADNGMYAARLWWMLRFMGHDRAAVLNGGLAAWLRQGREMRGGRETRPPTSFVGQPNADGLVTVDDVTERLGDQRRVLIDARAPARYRGESEPLDRVAGHIPGAKNRFFNDNLTAEQTFKTAEELRAEWLEALGGSSVRDVVVYCGSGVTACHDLLALEHAGLRGARLYAGSWSEWCADPDRPVETVS